MINLYAAILLAGISVPLSSNADENWLTGVWEFDREATYAQFQSMNPKPEDIIACYDEGGCGSEDRTLYTKTQQARLLDNDGDGIYIEVGKGRAEIAVESAEPDGDELIVVLSRSWSDKNLIFHFTGPDQYYAVISFKGFTWRYYQKRVEQ